VREQWWRVAAGILLGLVWISAMVAVPKLVQLAIDGGIRGGDLAALRRWSLLVLLSGAVVGIFTAGRHWFAATTSRRVEASLRHRLFDRFQRLDARFHDRHSTGGLMSRTNADLREIEGLFDSIPGAVSALLSAVAVAVILFLTNAPLAALSLLCLPLLAALTLRFSRRLHPIVLGVQRDLAALSETVEETVSGVQVVKGFGAEGARAARLRGEADRVYERSLRAARVRARYEPLFDLLPTLGLVVVLGYGGHLVLEDRLTIGELVAFNAYLLFLVWPLRWMGELVAEVQRGLAAAGRVAEVLDTDPEITDPETPCPPPPGEGEVRFEGVRFSYGERTVLGGLDLVVPAGTSVALVGPTGCGKTTAAMLVGRFYDPGVGRVLLDGADVRDLALSELRRAVGLVFEESFLFSGTVRENIAFAEPDASFEDLERAARLAGADGFIRALPEGYETVLGERGYSLSGGQRQRVAIARTILADPRVLILDDATSSVNPTKEHEIRAALKTAMRGRTTIVIAHRPATVALADRVALMKEGRVVAEGTHEELLATNACYREVLAAEMEPA
jgi:ATP-binding cassette subfamily B protein